MIDARKPEMASGEHINRIYIYIHLCIYLRQVGAKDINSYDLKSD